MKKNFQPSSKVFKDWFQNKRQICIWCSICPFHFSHRSLLCVFCAVIYDNKYLMLQVLLPLICLPSTSQTCTSTSVCPLSKLFIFQNETPQFALITVAFRFNYNSTADEVLLRFTYGSLRQS